MHIVYLDESGTHAEARYFVVAGLAAFERDTYYLSQALDKLELKYFPSAVSPVTFHAAPLHAPDGAVEEPFGQLTRAERHALFQEIIGAIVDSNARLFAVACEKRFVAPDHPYSRGIEQIANRFDLMLARILRDRGEDQRGLMVISESSYEENLTTLARQIWSQGHRWGGLHKMADNPFFAPAKSTRLLQLADFVSNAVYSYYENGYARDFNRLIGKFDREGDRLHGLVHLCSDRLNCFCPACVTRRSNPPTTTGSDDQPPLTPARA